jgi:hypothetical protein
MSLGDTDPWKVAVEAEVTKTVMPQNNDIPF